MVCVDVRKDAGDSNNLRLDLLNLNSSKNWFHSDELDETVDRSGKDYETTDLSNYWILFISVYKHSYFPATVIHRKGYLNVASVTQLEKDTLMVCYGGELQLPMLTKRVSLNKHKSIVEYIAYISYIFQT